jgi:sulfur carrier protein
MKISLNGEDYEAEEGASVHGLLEALDLAGQRVAVLLDGGVVRKAHFQEVHLKPGCKIDVIHMVGGG